MRWLDSTTDSMDMNLSKLWEMVKDRGAWRAGVREVTRSWTRLSDRRPPPISHFLFHFCFVPCIRCHLRGLILCPSVCALSRVGLFVTPWIAACQAYQSFTISQSLLKFTSTELVIPSNHILYHPLLLLPLTDTININKILLLLYLCSSKS